MKCTKCRKADADQTWWEKTRGFFFHLFPVDITNLGNDKFISGFGDGYTKAFAHIDGEGRIDAALSRIEQNLSMALRPLMMPTKLEAVNPDDVLEVKLNGGTGMVMLGGKPLDNNQIEILKHEADLLSRSSLWRIMQETVKSKALEKAVMTSKTWEEVLAGKMMLHNLEILDKLVKVILKLK